MAPLENKNHGEWLRKNFKKDKNFKITKYPGEKKQNLYCIGLLISKMPHQHLMIQGSLFTVRQGII